MMALHLLGWPLCLLIIINSVRCWQQRVRLSPVKCCKLFSQSCENVLMVIGGQNFNASSREHDMVYQVELLGQDKTCEVNIVFVFF